MEAALPPSYRAFLEVTNGLAGEAFTHRLVGTEDQKWAARQMRDVAEFWDDFDLAKVVPAAVPHADDGIHNLAAFDATKKSDELPVVDWDHGRVHRRFPTFEAYLRSEISTLRDVAQSHAAEAEAAAVEAAAVEAKAKAKAKAKAAGREALAAAKEIPKRGPAREAAFDAIFEETEPAAIAAAVERLLGARPSSDELVAYFERVQEELGARRAEGYARAELAFHPELKVPNEARGTWLELGEAVLVHFANEEPARAARWADVLRPAVRERASMGHALATAYASVGRKDDALAMVKEALAAGDDRARRMRQDQGLRPLFADPRFQALFGPPDDTRAAARTEVPRHPALEAQFAAGKSVAAYAAWLTKEGCALGEVVAADAAAERSPAKKRGARAAFAAYRKGVLDRAFPLLAPRFTTHLDPGYYFSFRYGFVERLDTFPLNNAKERAEALALLADPHGMFVKHLTLRGAKLADLELFGRLPALRRIHNAWTDITQVTSVEPLAKLTQLRALDLSRSKVKDLRPLARLPLVQLYLKGTEVVDLSPLADHRR